MLAIRIKFPKEKIIGAYEMTLNRRTEYVYKTLDHCQGFFIRRRNWKNLLTDHEAITSGMHDTVVKNYMKF